MAIALEFAPYAGENGLWPRQYRERHRRPGVYWAEQIRIQAAMREALGMQYASRPCGSRCKVRTHALLPRAPTHTAGPVELDLCGSQAPLTHHKKGVHV